MLPLLRTNPGVLITLLLLVGGAAVCLLFAVIMGRSGASLRPLVWFAALFGLVVLPQFVWHLRAGIRALEREAPRALALAALAPANPPGARADAARQLFGPDADPQRVADARPLFADALARAEVAQFAALPDGSTVLLARFPGYGDAEKAWFYHLRDTGLNQLGGIGDSQRGYAVTRPAGDRAYAVHLGRMIGVWTGRDDAAIRRRMAAGGFEVPYRAPLAAAAGAPAAASGASGAVAWVALGAACCALLVLLFFKGAAWAGSHGPVAGAARQPLAVVEERLAAINATAVPFVIERGTRPHEWIATWRYGDARWLDLAGANALRRTHRVRLLLDEAHGVARATDESTTMAAALGRGGAAFSWKADLGITFFQRETTRVFGLQFDPQGRPQPDLSYTYAFALDELKSPLIAAITQAGWTWRPTVWRGPSWLRWLTE